MAARTPNLSEEAALSLTLAVVGSSPGPLLLLDGELAIVAASASFATAFALDPEALPGRRLESLGAGEWDVPQLRSLLAATMSGAARIEAYEMDLDLPRLGARRLVVHAQRLVYLDLENRRLLVAVSDVTDARANERLRDDALRQNLILLQEVRHRVANSLQIIASVLMQNAKNTQSAETRGHLKDAHNRVMSVAALERHLAGKTDGTVELRGYFISLCDSITAAMIRDPSELALVVTGPGGVVDARVSISLGLIVTELVINALKYAFPDGRFGRIVVDFEPRGQGWTLTVSDDGVGMPSPPDLVRAGLGTSIVEALARQLGAAVQIAQANPGTKISIQRSDVDLAESDSDAGARHPSEQPAV